MNPMPILPDLYSFTWSIWTLGVGCSFSASALFLSLDTALEVKGVACVVIPTYRRGRVLLDTLNHLLALEPPPDEILVVDQTEFPPPEILSELTRLEADGQIRRIVLSPPSIPRAMNRGLLEAKGDVVLFLDDDVIPQPNLLDGHCRAYTDFPEAWAVVGQVIQPEDEVSAGRSAPVLQSSGSSFLMQDLDFSFSGDSPAWVRNAIACHLSVKRKEALAIGGFDVQFIPPVSYRFETEFAKRLVAAGGKIRFVTSAWCGRCVLCPALGTGVEPYRLYRKAALPGSVHPISSVPPMVDSC